MPVFEVFHRNRVLWLLPTAVFALALLFLFGVSRDASSSLVVTTSTPFASTGSVTIGDQVYDFAPDPCFLSEDAFLGSGPGRDGEDIFHVSSSPSVVELVFGIENDTDLPPDGAMWLSTKEVVEWSAGADGVSAEVVLFDRNDEDAPGRIAELRVSCALNS